MRRPAFIALAALLAVSANGGHSPAHVNDRGMDYSAYKDGRGVPCCNHVDCRPAADYVETVVHGQGVVRLLIDGRWISVSRYFVVAEDAPDGRAHWCGKMLPARRPVPTCIILPPKEM